MKRFFIYQCMACAILVTACAPHEKKPESPGTAVDHLIDSLSGSCPYLTSDRQGRTVLSWVRQRPDSSAVFCYAVSRDNGQSFQSPNEVPGSGNVFPHAENLPKVIFKPDGGIIAIWGAAHPNPDNQYAGVIYYCQSFDEGRTWSAVLPLVRDSAAKDQRYFDVQLLPNGEAAIAWLDARKTTPEKGSALYLASSEGTHGFGRGHLVEQPCCECCRINLAIDGNHVMHLMYRAIISDSVRDMVHAVSRDGGNHFSEPRRISSDNWVVNTCPHSGPSMAAGDGQVQVAWFTGGKESGIFYSRLEDGATDFAARDAVSSAGRHPQIARLANGNTVIAWEEPFQKGDKLYSRIGLEGRGRQGTVLFHHFITADTVQAGYPVLKPLEDGNVLVAYTVYTEKRPAVRYQRITMTDITKYLQPDSATPAMRRELPPLVSIANTKDPSCGMVLGKQARDTVQWKGKVLGFCSPECKSQFQEQHVHGNIRH